MDSGSWSVHLLNKELFVNKKRLLINNLIGLCAEMSDLLTFQRIKNAKLPVIILIVKNP